MSTVTVIVTARRSAGGAAGSARATRLERTLLSAATRLESVAVHRMQRRATRAGRSAEAFEETRRDAAAAAQLGLLPR